VVDRCHRFDFSRPSVPQIVSVLRRAVAAEQIEIPEEALTLVARAATGSFRDALGTLEQLLAYSGKTVELEDVLAVLGAADADLLLGVVDAVASGNGREALLAAARLAESGRDVGRFFADLEAHARGLMVVQTLGGSVPAELSVTPEQDARLAEQAARVPAADVVRLLDLIAAAMRAMKDGSDARTQLELALVKAATPEHEAGTQALLSRIERLEARLSGRAPEIPATAAGRRTAGRAEAPRPAAAEPPSGDGTGGERAAPAEPSGPTGGERAAPPESATRTGDDDVSAETSRPAGETAPAPSSAATAVADAPLDLEAFTGVWPAIVEAVEARSPLLAACLSHARPIALADDQLTLAWSSAFSKRKGEDPANNAVITEAIRAVSGLSVRLSHDLRPDDEPSSAPPALSEEELIARFMEEFDAEELPPDDPKQSEA
jgi:DNA polymerase-3 subunit gamma/tau